MVSGMVVLSSVPFEDSKKSEVFVVREVSEEEVLCDVVVSESMVEEDVVELEGLFLPQPEKISTAQNKTADNVRIRIFFIFIIYPFEK